MAAAAASRVRAATTRTKSATGGTPRPVGGEGAGASDQLANRPGSPTLRLCVAHNAKGPTSTPAPRALQRSFTLSLNGIPSRLSPLHEHGHDHVHEGVRAHRADDAGA